MIYEYDEIDRLTDELERLSALLMEVGEALNRAGWLLSLTNAASVLAETVGDDVQTHVEAIAAASAKFHEWKNPSGEVGNQK